MRLFNQTEKLAFNLQHPVKRDAGKVWRLFYGDNSKAWYQSTNYGYCRAEIKRLMLANPGYKQELFKIR